MRKMIKRLHLGSGRLEKLTVAAANTFLNKDWINLGDLELRNPNNRPLIEVDYSKINYQPFFYKLGDSLPFKDETFTFIFSEHFFEHLFFEHALGLFKECYRVMQQGGIIRVVVPDADLRPVPEMIGFPSPLIGYDQPKKHKNRWSIYNLRPALELSGFRVSPIKYYDLHGVLTDTTENIDLKYYNGSPDDFLITDFSYIKRKNSLIVDGIK